MKVIALEEHMATPEILAAWRRSPMLMADMTMRWSVEGPTAAALIDLGDRRLQAMDEAGIDVAVLSLTTPGLQAFEPREAVALQGPTNDAIADAVRRHPDRFHGFATLATPNPTAAAAELHRAVTELGLDGVMLHVRSGEHFVDEDRFWDIFEVAAHHRVPVYLHASITLDAVSTAYYRGFTAPVDSMFRSGAPGWHHQTGIVLIRMILAGVFDRFSDLQVVLGHWGEMVLFHLDRIAVLASTAHLQRPIADYFRHNVHITPSGVFSQRYLRWTTELLGTDRILNATDHPYSRPGADAARTFLTDAPLPTDHRAAIGSGNWERMARRIRR